MGQERYQFLCHMTAAEYIHNTLTDEGLTVITPSIDDCLDSLCLKQGFQICQRKSDKVMLRAVVACRPGGFIRNIHDQPAAFIFIPVLQKLAA